MVEIRGVSKSFQKTVKAHTTEVTALAGIDLLVRPNEFISIIGPSGCGKTTLLKMIDGLIPYDSGKILIDGRQVTAPGPDRAVVFQSFALLPWRTVLANVEFSLELRQTPKDQRAVIARDYLKRVGLSDFEDHYPHELSGGMQQRAGLARALVVNPSILLIPEAAKAALRSHRLYTKDKLPDDVFELSFNMVVNAMPTWGDMSANGWQKVINFASGAGIIKDASKTPPAKEGVLWTNKYVGKP